MRIHIILLKIDEQPGIHILEYEMNGLIIELHFQRQQIMQVKFFIFEIDNEHVQPIQLLLGIEYGYVQLDEIDHEHDLYE